MLPKKTILVYTNSYKKGSETFVLNHIKKLAQDNHVSVLSNVSGVQNLMENVDATAANLDFGIMYRLKKTFQSFKFLPKLWTKRNFYNGALLSVNAALKQKKYDIIYCHFGQNGKLMYELQECNLISGKIITVFHGLDFTLPQYQGNFYQNIIPYAKNIICVTEFSRKKLIEIGFNSENISVIPVPTYHYNQAILPKKKPEIINILFVTRFIELKGVLIVKHILQELRNQNFEKYKITFIGDGELFEETKEDLKDFKDNLLFLGKRSTPEIIEHYKDTYITIYPGITDSNGREENQCLAVQEGFAYKIPTIAFNIGGLSECVHHLKTGFLIEPKNYKGFAEAIITLYNDYELRNKLAEGAFDLYETKYSEKVIDSQYKNYLKKIESE